MRMRWPLAVGAWLAAAALATAASIGAVNSLRRGLFGLSDEPLRESEVQAQLSPTPSLPPPEPSGSATPSGSPAVPSAATRALTTDGGSLVASCTDGLATLVSWIPRAGWEADHVARGPAPAVSLRFKARSGGGAVRARVTCQDGDPALAIVGDE
ncbi:hypothetical protein [Dactylosporangium sp. NPDC048998]|uniref:hypothetical protein n=1 Tax=Dactylosporangium sp. NPDC048998 TaxID=3363976 RepID=UPI00371D193B